MSDRQHPSTLLVVGIGFVGVDPVILVGVILVGVGFVGGALHRDRRGKVFAHNNASSRRHWSRCGTSW
jgi:hypothetical protein